MTLWIHPDPATETRREHAEVVYRRYKPIEACVYCQSAMVRLNGEDEPAWAELPPGKAGHLRQGNPPVYVCTQCGWWTTYIAYAFGGHSSVDHFGAHGTLKTLDLTDISAPLDEIRRYLLARFDRRFDLHPRLFEETVASVLQSVGYSTEVTAYSNDGGIDVILRDSDEHTVGVQVKRWRNDISVEQIRALAGALMLNGHARGMFVTTSRFTLGSKQAALQAESIGLPIELIDGERFYEALQIGTSPMFTDFDSWRETVGAPTLGWWAMTLDA